MSNDAMNYRLEKDSIGTKKVPADAYYGVQTLRAYENFQITGEKELPEWINSLALIKKACAKTNLAAGALEEKKAEAIIGACDKILTGAYHDQFIVDPIQGGAGTSMNMNANEVIANVGLELMGHAKGDYGTLHPNDDVNRGQSTNDVIPTAGKLTELTLLHSLEAQLEALTAAFDRKADEFKDVIKMGRTQLEDAVPIRLGQEFAAYSSCVKRALLRIRTTKQEMYIINMGGTAIGTGLNANGTYYHRIASVLAEVSGEPFRQASDLVDATQNIDSFSAVSGAVKDCALSLSKIASDLRLMGSGPKTGLSEISLPAVQNGSSIMPGKVNPVIPEVVNQAAFRIAGNDLTISMAAEAGQLELNAFEPVVFYSLFQSTGILTNTIRTFIAHCVNGISANMQRCESLVDSSFGIVTALNPYIGYQRAASIAKEAMKTGRTVREIVQEDGILSPGELKKVLDPAKMTQPNA